MKTSKRQFSRHVSVPSDEGIRVDKAVTIEKPVNEVYAFWRDLENLPRFMRHVKSVTRKDDLHSHWVVKTVGGKTVEWDAEIIEQRENEMVSWRSAPGADVDNAGSVWFTPVPGGSGTIVRVEMKYVPPAGSAGAAVAKVFGRDAESEIEDDLQRLKSLLETGKVPEEEGSERWRRITETTRRAAHATDDYVHDNPWLVIASVTVTCFVAGVLIARAGD
ncbi:MAG TPA: SRPBCC family protein [Candidatus Dormibacteraeota bacterium]|nr:SRPBCC family protein [Candidatus Dormibacteraeota bacterium]